jgi:prefoldin subunit 5
MDRLDRVERTLEEMSRLHDESLKRVDARLEYMAARQQYHDEAFERFDSRMKRIEEAIAIDAENIRALARIAEAHQRRLDEIQGESPA